MCARCGSLATDTQESTGRGTVHSWIVSHHPTEPDEAPRVVILVDLEEGTRIVSNLIDTALYEIHNGMAVDVCFVDHGERRAPPVPARRAGGGGPMRDVAAHRRAVIAGIGHTEFSQNSGRSTLQLAAEASLAAIRDAGIEPRPTSTATSPSPWTPTTSWP